jgi:hypothetical protein
VKGSLSKLYSLLAEKGLTRVTLELSSSQLMKRRDELNGCCGESTENETICRLVVVVVVVAAAVAQEKESAAVAR